MKKLMMKRSELKELIREVCKEYDTNKQFIKEETSQKETYLFNTLFDYIKKQGSHKRHYNQLPIPGVEGGWSGDEWKFRDIKASVLNKHYNKEIVSPELWASMDQKGNILYSKGGEKELVALLKSLYTIKQGLTFDKRYSILFLNQLRVCSSMVEQVSLKDYVVGSSPIRRATFR